jgi:predicted nucleotidyltransferase
MELHGVTIPEAELAAYARRHGMRRVALFGSILREDFGPGSDVDVLVEFFPDRVPGLFELSAMREELSLMLGRTVDLRTPAFLSRYFRDDVLRNVRVAYAA